MPRFTYKAKRGLNETVEGDIIAANADEALSKLAAQELFPVEITEAEGKRPETKDVGRRTWDVGRGARAAKKKGRRVSSGDLFNFTQKLTTLTRAKVELLASLKILYEQAENPRFHGIIQEIYNITKGGKPLSESFLLFPDVFPPLFVNVVKAGEASGRLDQALEQISSFLARSENLKTKIRVALAYPAMLLTIGCLSIFVLMNFVVPKLKPIFAGLGKNLPLITKVILGISEASHKAWWLILIIAALMIFILRERGGAAIFGRVAKGVKMNLPVLKDMTKNTDLAYLSQSLTLLLKSGVPALKSLQIAAPTVENPRLRKELENACAKVASGVSLSSSMQAAANLPGFFTKMIAVGEESGRLTEVLEEISQSYIQRIEADIALISSLVEPILILLLGSALGIIVLSILLPTFQMTQVIR